MTIRKLIEEIEEIYKLDPRLNDFGIGPMDDLQDDIKYYPYLWVVNNEPSDLIINTDGGGYQTIEYNLILRIGDKVNNQKNIMNRIGEGSNNGLDVSFDTMQILIDIINTITKNITKTFDKCTLNNNISIEPFYHEEGGDVNGHQALLIFRTNTGNQCNNPITEIK